MLESLLVLHWHHCQHCAGFIASVAPALSPLSHGCLCPHRTHIVTSIANWHLPSHNAVLTHRCTCCRGCALHCHLWLCCCNLHPSMEIWPSMIWPMQCCRLCQTRIALASSPASCCHHCWHYASFVALVMQVSLPSSRWHHCPPSTHVTASIANWHLPSHAAVATHWHMWHCCRAPCCHQWLHGHTRHWSTATWPLMVQLMQRWRLCQRCAGILAGIILASLSALLCHCCWCHTSVVALAAQTSSPSLRWHCHLCCTRIAASIPNWRLPSQNAVATHWH